MASTTFVDGETLIEASWLNDVNTVAYSANLATLSAHTVGTTTGNIPLWESLLLNGALSKVDNYEVTTMDRGKLIEATTGTWVLTMNPTTLGANFAFVVKNSGSGMITLTPSTGTIDGAATLELPAGGSAFVFCDGANFETVGLSNVAIRTSNVTPIASAGSAVNVPHSLGVVPSHVTLELLCLVAEGGYGIGAVAEVTGEWAGAGIASPLSIWKTPTAVGFTMSSGEGLFLRNVSTGDAFFPTPGNWAYRFVLRK